jgi:hypothetical protein
MKTLFSLSAAPKSIKHPDPKYSDRLLCVEIPKSDAEVTDRGVSQAVKDRKKWLKGQIEVIRAKDEATARDGRLYAFYSQMYLNCELALEELSSVESLT